jgi:hypothetical protein
MKQLVVTLAMLAGLQLGLHAQTYSTLYTFDDGTDGNTISGKLILDTNGNLYGESSGGGSTNCTPRCGTVFELTPNNGVWTKTILYNFLGVSRLSWKWRERSSVKIAERTYEERA